MLKISDTVLSVVQQFISSPAGVLLTASPALLLAPEGATIGGIYLLIIALNEGGTLLVRFTCSATYRSLKSLFTSSNNVSHNTTSKNNNNNNNNNEISENELNEWVIIPDKNDLLMNEFELLDINSNSLKYHLQELTATNTTTPSTDVSQSIFLHTSQ